MGISLESAVTESNHIGGRLKRQTSCKHLSKPAVGKVGDLDHIDTPDQECDTGAPVEGKVSLAW